MVEVLATKLIWKSWCGGLKGYIIYVIPHQKLILNGHVQPNLEDGYDGPLQVFVVWSMRMDIAARRNKARTRINFIKGCVEGVEVGDYH